MKKWIMTIFIIAFLLSISFNYLAVRKDINETNELLSEYKYELLRSASAFQESVNPTPIREPIMLRTTAFQAVEVASQLAYILGKHEAKYSPNNRGKIYKDFPVEMQWLLMETWEPETIEDKLERINKILQIYAKELKATDIKNPDGLVKAHMQIHYEIQQNGLLKDDINFPFL